jgi:Glutaredoxin-like domain (DUF836)
MAHLLLFTRQGCCLCQGLLERLQALDPAPSLQLVDIDGDPALQARYGERVPLLALPAGGAQALRELPWVPPRLVEARLQEWLRQHGAG